MNYEYIAITLLAVLVAAMYSTCLSRLRDMRDYIFDINRKADRALDENKILRYEIDRLNEGLVDEQLKINESKTSNKPKHLERCLCYDKFLCEWCIYVYDDLSKYWCDADSVGHDPDGDNHVSDYADYRITHWMRLPNNPNIK